MRTEFLSIIRKYRVPLSDVDKEVLLDEDLYGEAASFLGESHVFYAFPGFFFKFGRGICHERGVKARAVEGEFGVRCLEDVRPFSGQRVFSEPEHGVARALVEEAVGSGIERGVFVARESVLIRLVAEPGWREYSPVSVISSLFYDVEAFRVENQAFFFGRSPMGMAFLRRKKEFEGSFVEFLERVFREGRVGGRRVEKTDPEEFLELYTTHRTTGE